GCTRRVGVHGRGQLERGIDLDQSTSSIERERPNSPGLSQQLLADAPLDIGDPIASRAANGRREVVPDSHSRTISRRSAAARSHGGIVTSGITGGSAKYSTIASTQSAVCSGCSWRHTPSPASSSDE